MKNRDKLVRKLKAIPKEVRKEMRVALAVGGDEMVDLAQRAVPKRRGRLSRSIAWRYGDDEQIAYSQGIKANHELAVTISAGNSQVRYAHLVEFGTQPHINKGKFKGTRHPGTAASPFFYPAWRLTKRRAKSRVTRAMNKAIKRIAAK